MFRCWVMLTKDQGLLFLKLLTEKEAGDTQEAEMGHNQYSWL